jgi:hypothetical protein
MSVSKISSDGKRTSYINSGLDLEAPKLIEFAHCGSVFPQRGEGQG